MNDALSAHSTGEQPDLMAAREMSLLPDDRVRSIADEITDMGPTPTARQWAAVAELKRRGLNQ